jgi:hypothetical protein
MIVREKAGCALQRQSGNRTFRPYWNFSMMNGRLMSKRDRWVRGTGKRIGRAGWPSTEDTDWCGSFKPRSDAESEPDKEEF